MIPLFETFCNFCLNTGILLVFSNSSAGGVGAGGLANSEAANRNLSGVSREVALNS